MPKKIKTSKKVVKKTKVIKKGMYLYVRRSWTANKDLFLEKEHELICIEKKHKRAKKDKDAPKRALTAFFCYLKARRESLKKEQPKLSNTEIVSVCFPTKCF